MLRGKLQLESSLDVILRWNVPTTRFPTDFFSVARQLTSIRLQCYLTHLIVAGILSRRTSLTLNDVLSLNLPKSGKHITLVNGKTNIAVGAFQTHIYHISPPGSLSSDESNY
jgi:hypothetical protein